MFLDIMSEREYAMGFIRTLFNEKLSSEGYKALDNLECQISVLLSEMEENREQLLQNRYLTLPEAAKIMNISRKRLDEIIRENKIPIIKYTSKTLLLDLRDIRKYIESLKVLYSQVKDDVDVRDMIKPEFETN